MDLEIPTIYVLDNSHVNKKNRLKYLISKEK